MIRLAHARARTLALSRAAIFFQKFPLLTATTWHISPSMFIKKFLKHHSTYLRRQSQSFCPLFSPSLVLSIFRSPFLSLLPSRCRAGRARANQGTSQQEAFIPPFLFPTEREREGERARDGGVCLNPTWCFF